MSTITFTKNISQELKTELKRYVSFCVSNLMQDIQEDLEINIVYGSGGCFDAYVEVADEDYGELDPRAFNIHIDQSVTNIDDLLLTVCHEMVHVKQFAYNEIQETEEPARCVWKGEEFLMTSSKADYYNTPWEVEAYGKENGLYWACTEYYQAIDALLGLK